MFLDRLAYFLMNFPDALTIFLLIVAITLFTCLLTSMRPQASWEQELCFPDLCTLIKLLIKNRNTIKCLLNTWKIAL